MEQRHPAGSLANSPAAVGVHGAHPLGSAVLRRQTSADHDVDERSKRFFLCQTKFLFVQPEMRRVIFILFCFVFVPTVETVDPGCCGPFIPAGAQ